ncbi:MAG: Mur ligase family protein [Spirochaetes bacterium]|nr:Mur ligase family protein [Spirochaetota bacterium]
MNASTLAGFMAFAVALLFLVAERIAVRQARSRFKLVVHVNGTRGKSTVTRMIHALLREAGYMAWGKTTGTEPRLLLPDGRERLIRRWGPANVREQRTMLFRAAVSRADALVFECNAVRPELQLVSASYLDANLLVLTNARLDHRLEQGSALDAAEGFAATIPPGGTVISSDPVHRLLWEQAAAKAGARFIFIDPIEGEGLGDMPENSACALAVADWLELPRDRAAKALSGYSEDPGAFLELSWSDSPGCRTLFMDASAANEPESTDRLARLAYSRAEAAGSISTQRLLVIASRADRPDRSILFAEYATGACVPGGLYDEAIFLGPVPLAARRRLKRSGIRYSVIRKPAELDRAPGATAVQDAIDVSKEGRSRIIVAAGNRGGHGKLLHDWALAKAGHVSTSISGQARGEAR